MEKDKPVMTDCQFYALSLIAEGFKMGVLVLAAKSTLRALKIRHWMTLGGNVSEAGYRALDMERHRRVSHT